MSSKNICRVCGAGHLTRQSAFEKFTYKGVTESYEHVSSICDVCLVDQADAEEMRLNKRAVIRLKKVIDGLLPGDEMRAIRKAWCITQGEASLVFGGGPKAFSKYETDDVSQSESMDKFIRAAAKFPPVFKDLCESAGIKPAAVEVKSFSVQHSSFTWSGDGESMTAYPDVLEVSH